MEKHIVFISTASAITPLFPQLKEAGIEVGLAENMKALSPFLRKDIIAIFTRAHLNGYKAEELFEFAKEQENFPPIYILAEEANVEESAYFLELGAKDYWLDPIQISKILTVVKNIEQSANSISTQAKNSTLGRGQQSYAFSDSVKIVGSNKAIQRVLQLAKQVAKSRASVLISGESGTGKEMFARTLHAWSNRANMPFIAVNCAALPEHLLESELFGHEKGAFTGAIARKPGKFELANGGTILLDEISEMDPALQAKLLRVLQEGEVDRLGGTETVKVDVRVLATTNREMEKWIDDGKFRQDLYFRLNVIPLRLPSLSERGDDIIELAEFFTQKYTEEYQLPASTFSEEARNWLLSYPWPGNVRELQNLMERAVLLSNGQPINPQHFLLTGEDWPLFMDHTSEIEENVKEGKSEEPSDKVDTTIESFPLDQKTKDAKTLFSNAVIPLHEMERIMIMKGLEETQGNRTQAAELLGISVRTLRNKLNEYREKGVFDK